MRIQKESAIAVLIVVVFAAICFLFSVTEQSKEPFKIVKPIEIPTQSEVHKNIMAASVRINTQYKLFGLIEVESSGSGVAIACKKVGKEYEIYFLTAAHVVKSPQPMNETTILTQFFVEGVGENRIMVEVLEICETDDIALIKIKTKKPYPIVKIASNDSRIKIFTNVYAVGCKLGMIPTPTGGVVTGQRYESIGLSKLWGTSACCIYGNSGGGIFLKKSGELIGIVSVISLVRTQLYNQAGEPIGGMTFTPLPHMSYFVPVPKIRAFIESTKYKWILE